MILFFTCCTLLVVAECPQQRVVVGISIDLVEVLEAFWPEMAFHTDGRLYLPGKNY